MKECLHLPENLQHDFLISMATGLKHFSAFDSGSLPQLLRLAFLKDLSLSSQLHEGEIQRVSQRDSNYTLFPNLHFGFL